MWSGIDIDLLCFSCHKSLYSIQGLGAIYMKDNINLKPLRFGGTGSKSESIEQPTVLPDKYESGTPNTPAIASLYGGLTFIENTGFTKIIEKKKVLRESIAKGLSTMERCRIIWSFTDGACSSFTCYFF